MSGLYLVARLGGRGVLIATGQVESVVDIGEIVPAPGAAPAVLGLAALRSRVVTVIDSWGLLGLDPPADAATRAVVCVVDGQRYALMVESLEDVASFVVQPLESGVTPGVRWAAAATGAAERDGEPMIALDVAALIGSVTEMAD